MRAEVRWSVIARVRVAAFRRDALTDKIPDEQDLRVTTVGAVVRPGG